MGKVTSPALLQDKLLELNLDLQGLKKLKATSKRLWPVMILCLGPTIDEADHD